MKKMIAYCGLDCDSCEARIATVRGDDALRAEVARLWSELNGADITKDMINCDGCRADGRKTPFCESLCPIRQCALQKAVGTCGDCGDMARCEKLGMIVANNPAALENLKRGGSAKPTRAKADTEKQRSAAKKRDRISPVTLFLIRPAAALVFRLIFIKKKTLSSFLQRLMAR